MPNIKIGSKEYDLSRCTRDQLQSYVADLLDSGEAHSAFESGQACFAAALVPTEDPSVVATELAEYCAAVLGTADHWANAPLQSTDCRKIRQITDRYRKAAGI